MMASDQVGAARKGLAAICELVMKGDWKAGIGLWADTMLQTTAKIVRLACRWCGMRCQFARYAVSGRSGGGIALIAGGK